jgi:recombination protein RecT
MSNIEKTQKSVVETVSERVNQLVELGQLNLPKDYSAPNAVRAAWLVLQDKPDILKKASPPSVINAMFKMVISGLSVVKKQGDFILYGDKLTFSPEYHGNKALCKRFCDVKEVTHQTIYQDDVFEYAIDKNGRKQIIKHEQKVANIDPNKIVAAYAIVTFNDGTTQAEVMSMQQIRQSWMQGATKGQSPAHKNFPDAMSEKTVANRLMTRLINASDDAAIISSIDNDENDDKPKPQAAPKSEIKTVSFDEAEVIYETKEETPENTPEKPVETPKVESKPDTPKKEEKPVKQPETLFDETNDDQPF